MTSDRNLLWFAQLTDKHTKRNTFAANQNPKDFFFFFYLLFVGNLGHTFQTNATMNAFESIEIAQEVNRSTKIKIEKKIQISEKCQKRETIIR